MKLDERDKKIIWHPFTQEKTAPLPIAIKKAKGAYLYDEDNNAYLDLISSWWVNLHGHAHPKIAKAIYEQALTLEHVIFAGFTHEPAVLLCEQLKKILPSTLSRFFFSDNGSTSVEVALKMAYQYRINQGQEKPLFLSFEGGYHGDTVGAMSLGAQSGFHQAFKKLLFKVLTLPFPHTWDEDKEVSIKENETLAQLETYLYHYKDNITAFILEPLVQGASGMRMCRPEFIKKIVERVKAQGILIIYDEIMTGFGRTGTLFALEQIGVTPDFICLSKGITGGFLPLALTVTTETIYKAFLSKEWSAAFAHGHSYTANPLACAAALASFNLLTHSNTLLALKRMYKSHQKGIAYLKEQGAPIEHTRIKGTICAFEVACESSLELNQRLKTAFMQAGLVIRPLGNTIYLLPPYCVTDLELDQAYKAIAIILKKLS